jgi:hypothetical protein
MKKKAFSCKTKLHSLMNSEDNPGIPCMVISKNSIQIITNMSPNESKNAWLDFLVVRQNNISIAIARKEIQTHLRDAKSVEWKKVKYCLKNIVSSLDC